MNTSRLKIVAALLCAAPSVVFSATSNTLDEVVVTATRFVSTPKSSPENITVITASDIERSAAKTLPELLMQHAGIQVRSNDGTADMMVDLRGFGMTGNQNTLVLLDGQQLNDIELTSVRWSSIPLDSIERIEIINGSGSVLYGGGATGGTINIITKKGHKGVRNSISAGVSSYDTKEARLSLGTQGERTSLRISVGTLDSGNYRANNDISQSNLEGDVRTAAGNGDAVLKFGADVQDLRFPGARRVDPTLGLDQLASDRRGTATPLDYGHNRGQHVSLGTSQQLGFGELAVELAYRDTREQAYYAAYGGNYLDTDLNRLSLTPRLKMTHQIGGTSNELVVGVDLVDWAYDSGRSTNPATIGMPVAHVIARQSNRALYAQNATLLDADTMLTLGARIQRTDYQASDTVNPAIYAAASQGRGVSVYEIGLRHDLSPALSLFGRIGRSFRVATVDEIYAQYGGPLFDSSINMLEPQKSLDREIGVDYKNGSTAMHAAIYTMDLTNEIHYNAITFANMNLSPTRRYGLELEGSHAWSDKFAARAAYSYTVARFRDGVYGGINVSGNDIPLVPRQRLALGASWKLSEKTALNGNIVYVGKQHFDNDQANAFGMQMPAYTTVDVKYVHQSGSWSLAAAVNNLLGERYFTYAVASTSTPGVYNAYPMPERNFSLNAKYQF